MTMIFLCLAGTLLNITISRLSFLSGIPLYLDTILTISVTLTGGVLCGAVCAALTNIIYHTLWGYGWEGYLFAVCNIATAFITWLFIRIFPGELDLPQKKPLNNAGASVRSSLIGIIMDRVIVLIIFSFALCLGMSFLGGFIATVIILLDASYIPSGSGIAATFSTTMFKGNAPVIIAEIVSRIPVNIIDRLLSSFGGYGIALCLYKVFCSKHRPRKDETAGDVIKTA